METSSIDRTTEAAARWYARLHSSSCTQQDRDEFVRWRAQDPAHAAAYAAARSVADGLKRAAATNQRLQAMADQAFALGKADGRFAERRQRWAIPSTLAAGLVTVALVLGFSQPLWRTPAETTTYATAAGEQRNLTLEDGTAIHLDVDSQIEVRLTAAERRVALTQGRAVFDVAHDAERPFSVATGLGRVTALGTRFQVERAERRTIVTLAEGSVLVSSIGTGMSRTEQLEPGEQLTLWVGNTAWIKREVDPRAAISWSAGRHVFRGTRLADALDEVNRYARVKVRLADPTLADLHVSGNFVTGDSELIVSAFAAVLPIKTTSNGEELLLSRRGGGGAASYNESYNQ